MVTIMTNILSALGVVNWIAFKAPLRLPQGRSIPRRAARLNAAWTG